MKKLVSGRGREKRNFEMTEMSKKLNEERY